MAEVFEYRGVDNVVIAEVTGDDNEASGGYVTGDVMPLLPVAEIGKTVETSSEAHYYDNQPMIVINSEGSDEITITGAGMDIEKLAKITGKSYDPTTGALIDGPRVPRYFALGYRTKGTDGKYRHVWRYKGQFAIPDETNATEDDGTEANGTELTFTGVFTIHKFTKGKYNGTSWEKAPVKGIVVDERKVLADVSTFFDTVTTPDTLTAKS